MYPGLAALVAVVWLAVLPARPLFDPDEGRYAEIPREMLATHEWIIPHLDGLAYIEKPPLQYWATAAVLKLLGRDEFAARLYTALCALATLVVVWLAALRLWGRPAAWRAAAALCSMLLFVVLGQLLTLDMSLTFYMTLALACFLMAQVAAEYKPESNPEPEPEAEPKREPKAEPKREPKAEPKREPKPEPDPEPELEPKPKPDPEPKSERATACLTLAPESDVGQGPRSAIVLAAALSSPHRGWILAAWTATALAVLTKGVVAAAIPAAVLLLYSLYARDFSPWRRLSITVGLPLFLAVSVPWHWLAAQRQPGFLQFYFVHEHVARFLTPSANREQPWWFFAAVFVLGSIPWTLPVLRAVATRWRRRVPQGHFDPVLFLWIWVVFIGVFFSLSDSKLIPYVLPAMPGLALLVAASPVEELGRDLRWTAFLTLLVAFALAAVGMYGPRFLAATDRNQYFAMLNRPMGEVAALLAVSGAFVLLRRCRNPTDAAVFLSVGWCLSGLLLMRAAAVAAPIYSGVVLARAQGAIPGGVPLYSVATYDQTLPFYWQRTFKLVAYRGELDFGLRQEPSAEIPRIADFIAEWWAVEDGYAVMEKSMFDELKSRGLPMREVTRDVSRVLVARR
jgi:4-amino-4-deoxy-L-arabinose transferase-like glycosyltransferase